MNAHTRSSLFLIFLVTLASLSGCNTQLTREQSDNYYDDCMREGGSRAGKVFVCLRAIHSGNYSGTNLADLYFMKGIHQQDGGQHGKAISDFTDALEINPNDAEAYFYRGWSQRELGNLGEAQADFDTALRFGHNAEYERAARETAQEIDDQYRYYEESLRPQPTSLVLNGMWCPSVQRDSVFYPANEIHIDVVVTDAGGGYQSTALPSKSGVYKGIKKGAKRRIGKTVWRGVDQPINVQVVMWEYDDGGPLVDSLTEIAVDFALTRGTKTLSKAAVRQGVNATAARTGRYAAKQAIEQFDLGSQLSRRISSLPKALVGANNDLVGAIGLANASSDSYGPPATEAGFRYDFYTRLRGGGADCRVYFEFAD